ncbi:MAG: RNA methyltransferase [Hydrogenibacillus schlegelii]|nr:RNA methyltransferase [Hydrogenibacillus schlegelii]
MSGRSRPEEAVIASPHNPRIQAWARLKTPRERRRSGRFLVEGPHLVAEALHDPGLEAVLVAAERAEAPPLRSIVEAVEALRAAGRRISLVRLGAAAVRRLAETETPQGIFAVVRLPSPEGAWSAIVDRAPFILVLDGVSDPGNVGTLLRSADAFGAGGVIVGPGSADPWSGKVLRSAQGTHFHLPIYALSPDGSGGAVGISEADESEAASVRAAASGLAAALEALRRRGVQILATHPRDGIDIEAVRPAGRFALVIGNEARGVSPAALRLSDQNVRIMQWGRAESLNAAVAGSILLYVLGRHRARFLSGGGKGR